MIIRVLIVFVAFDNVGDDEDFRFTHRSFEALTINEVSADLFVVRVVVGDNSLSSSHSTTSFCSSLSSSSRSVSSNSDNSLSQSLQSSSDSRTVVF